MPRFVGHRDANWDAMSFDLDKDLALTLKNASFIEASDPNLSKFKARGGKLLLWHGWADPGPAPETRSTITRGDESRRRWIAIRLDAIVPDAGSRALWWRNRARPGGLPWYDGTLAGTGCCSGQVTAHATRSEWTDTDDAPVVSVPAVAKYKGTGSTDEALNFVCSAP